MHKKTIHEVALELACETVAIQHNICAVSDSLVCNIVADEILAGKKLDHTQICGDGKCVKYIIAHFLAKAKAMKGRK